MSSEVTVTDYGIRQRHCVFKKTGCNEGAPCYCSRGYDHGDSTELSSKFWFYFFYTLFGASSTQNCASLKNKLPCGGGADVAEVALHSAASAAVARLNLQVLQCNANLPHTVTVTHFLTRALACHASAAPAAVHLSRVHHMPPGLEAKDKLGTGCQRPWFHQFTP